MIGDPRRRPLLVQAVAAQPVGDGRAHAACLAAAAHVPGPPSADRAPLGSTSSSQVPSLAAWYSTLATRHDHRGPLHPCAPDRLGAHQTRPCTGHRRESGPQWPDPLASRAASGGSRTSFSPKAAHHPWPRSPVSRGDGNDGGVTSATVQNTEAAPPFVRQCGYLVRVGLLQPSPNRGRPDEDPRLCVPGFPLVCLCRLFRAEGTAECQTPQAVYSQSERCVRLPVLACTRITGPRASPPSWGTVSGQLTGNIPLPSPPLAGSPSKARTRSGIASVPHAGRGTAKT